MKTEVEQFLLEASDGIFGAASLPGINVCVMKITFVVRKARNDTGFMLTALSPPPRQSK